MTPYYDDGQVVIYHGDCREVLPSIPFDAVVTDPPYGIYVADLEFAWTNCVARPALFEREWRGATRGSERGQHYHPTQKPVDLMRWCLGLLPASVEVVADPYMGSGSTLRAAKDLGRPCVGVEIEERYCEMAAKRLAQDAFDFGAPAEPPQEVVNL